MSRYSKGSTSSSARQRRQDLEEAAAILKAKMCLTQEKEELDRANQLDLVEIEGKMLEIQQEEKRIKEQIELSKEKFKIKEELAQAEARIEVYKRYEDTPFQLIVEVDSKDGSQDHMQKFLESQPDLSHPTMTTENETEITNISRSPESQNHEAKDTESKKLPTNPLNPHFPNYVPNNADESTVVETYPKVADPSSESEGPVNAPTATTTSQDEANILQTQLCAITKLLETHNQGRLPIPEPGIFNGDPLKYPIWLKAFETLIESRAVNPAERLHFLGRYVAGEAKEVIQGFMLMAGEDTYQRAKEMLSKRYGDPFAVTSAFRKKLDVWPQIAPYDSLGLRKYADFIDQCEKAIEKVASLKVLNDDQENQKMASKLPKWALSR